MKCSRVVSYSLSEGLPTETVVCIIINIMYLKYFWSNKHFCLPVCLVSLTMNCAIDT